MHCSRAAHSCAVTLVWHEDKHSARVKSVVARSRVTDVAIMVKEE